MSTAFLVDSLLHAQRAQSYSESQLKSSLSEMLLSRGPGEPAAEERSSSSELLCNCNCAKRGYKCDKCRENRAESVDSIEEMELDDDEDDEDEDEIVADIDSVETPHLDEEELDDELEREAIKLPKVEPKESSISNNSTTGGTTILKDNNSKPILKFSVSAILGDTREGVRVRNGKGKKW
ncbi:GH16165 [Drosophila grimshawi]|uniref:GH16165 n=1 Tax=Drosophila grimshawi TaxID=7222 RepID=B4IWQ5_DROGR|nr:GH16165 [Drosophila grimshawi]